MRSGGREIRGDPTALAGRRVSDGIHSPGGASEVAFSCRSFFSRPLPRPRSTCVEPRPSERFDAPLLCVLGDAWRSFHCRFTARKEVRQRVNR